VFSLRLQIEPGAVARGAKLATAADHAAARALLERLHQATAAGEFASSGQLNRAFHLLLIVPRLQPVAAEILGRLHTLAQRYVQAHLRPEGRARRASREHAALLKAWEAADPRRVRVLMHGHIKSTRDDLDQRLSG
jgi:DNA-binding GntR family transcriptional regulator